MERYSWVSGTVLGSLLILLNCVSDTSGQSNSTHKTAYFNATLGSYIHIPTVLSLQTHTAFSFRTCSYGQLLKQTGHSGDTFSVTLSSNGSLLLAWNVSGQSDNVQLGWRSLANNDWYTLDINFKLGNITAKVERGSTELYRQVISRADYRRYLWDVDLTAGTPIVVGYGFTGCIQEASNVQLSHPAATGSSVRWGECPLENAESATECASFDVDDCWSHPCLNRGKCVDGFRSYTCECPVEFTGSNCETDQGYLGCLLNPCRNNGTCTNNSAGFSRKYQCHCMPGYTGVNCEIQIDACQSGPCKHGTCSSQVNNYTCDCTGTGYEGSDCDQNIDECTRMKPCQNNATCSDTPGGYKCACLIGYAGVNCEQEAKACQSNPCLNNGQCRDLPGRYECECAVGFTGGNCETNINNCRDVVLQENFICVDGVDTYVIRCKPGYYDPNNPAGNVSECLDVDECSSNPCQHSATCHNGENLYTCECAAGYTGINCETDVDECAAKPCGDGGSCTDLVNGYTCNCSAGYTGVNCETNIDECSSQPCQNGAQCNDMVNGYTCSCAGGWTGVLCESDIDECLSLPCRNNGQCQNLQNAFSCSCAVGFTGIYCETNINDCTDSVCQNGGTCVDQINAYTCNCTQDWMGQNCTQKYDICAFSPCANGGTCQLMTTPPSRDFTCSCLAGYTGDTCQVDIDECVTATCPSYMRCVDGVNSYTCQCPPGYTGSMCETKIDYCAVDPCQNGATCIDNPTNYTCQCQQKVVDLRALTNDSRSLFTTGWQGSHCEQDINECNFDPPLCLNNAICLNHNGTYECLCRKENGMYYAGDHCERVTTYCQLGVDDPPACKNGGTCRPLPGEFACYCAPGYTGLRCETDIDECASVPCQYNGTCTDRVNGYNCSCIPGITGSNCEINIQECASKPCQNGGGCLDLINADRGDNVTDSSHTVPPHTVPSQRWYVCNCTDTGFNGSHCQFNIDDCASLPCVNGGSCKDGIKDYSCSCYPGYTGKNCDVDINECLSQPCQNNATCRERSKVSSPNFDFSTAHGYDCQCVPGYTGLHCETDIDECESNPCVHGTCVDKVNSYICSCEAGYRGTHCEIEINECKEYKPCRNSATCRDKVADYDCLCPPTFEGKPYAGKNCSVELIGCKNHSCLNNAKCIPYLVDESTNTHDYKCKCPPGFQGRFCGVNTTASFSGETRMYYQQSVGLTDLELVFRFRTTLSDDRVILHISSGTSNVVDVKLVRGQHLSLRYSNEKIHKELQTEPAVVLNDAEWHEATVKISRDGFRVQVCSAGQCTSSKSGGSDDLHGLGTSYIGGAASGDASLGWVGCLQDISFNNVTLIPENLPVTARSPELGCPRTEQCSPDPCNSKGQCADLWNKYQCLCYRPHAGKNCELSFTAATFGYEKTLSLISFAVPQSERSMLANYNDISFFLRTHKPSGQLFYLGEESGETYLSIGLVNGFIEIRTQLQSGYTFVMDGKKVDDGQQHFVQVIRNQTQLTITVDQTTRSPDLVIISKPLVAAVLYVGSLPTVPSAPSGRRRRAVSLDPVDHYKGTLQDLRLNNKLLQFYNLSASDLPPSYPAPLLNNVTKGEQNDDTCAAQPCENNGTCQVVFWNDFRCICPDGWRGKNCSELDFCVYNRCPGNGTVCKNQPYGYDCVSPATFDGSSSMLQYSNNVNESSTFNTFSVQFRTRQRSGTLFHAASANGSVPYMTVQLLDGDLQIQYDLGEASKVIMNSGVREMTNGEWQTATVTFNTATVSLQVGNNTASVNSTQTHSLTDIVFQSDNIFVGGVSSSYHSSNSPKFAHSEFFKGCLNEVRVGGLLLPIFNQSELQNNTSPEQFAVQKMRGIRVGCYGDPVCEAHQCKNGATCRDIWNSYECDCPIGFNGTFCGDNIDDCVNSECQNGATCQDGIANYTCSCVPGFTGQWCQTDIYECASQPCLNNGTCWDQVNGFVCNCTANYTGEVCQIKISEGCTNETCRNNGTCEEFNTTIPGEITFNCTCQPGFEGDYCEREIDYCADQPCQNGANCTSVREILDYTCSCNPGYTDKNCSTEIDECSSEPCQNGGNCTDLVNGYNCTCPPGWTGTECEENINECNVTSTPVCDNSGVCVDTPGSFYCNCTGTGFNGSRCETDINECEVNKPCMNNATCGNVDGSYICNCTRGYNGTNCEVPNCDSENCLNNGTCLINSASQTWSCQCPQFYEGFRCETAGPCVTEQCLNGGTCSQSGDQFICTCAPGWTGRNCESDINECDSTPCKNGATCNNMDGTYNCTCSAGFTGSACETNINECESDPCQHGGVCSDGIAGYTCDCAGTGYEGADCESDVNECNKTALLCNNGQCNNLPGTFNCTCNPGYVGNICHSLDPCTDASRCRNGGTCRTLVNDTMQSVDFACDCTSGWSGRTCKDQEPGKVPLPANLPLPLLIGLAVGGLVLIILILIIVFLMIAKTKRATRGTYSPSRQEHAGSRVEMDNVMKPPPEERLI